MKGFKKTITAPVGFGKKIWIKGIKGGLYNKGIKNLGRGIRYIGKDIFYDKGIKGIKKKFSSKNENKDLNKPSQKFGLILI